MPAFRAPPGTRDVFSPESNRWRRLVDVFERIVAPAGYGLVIPPMFEELAVFARVGETTDIVTKEMYDFHDKGGRHVALRPEQTASVVRAFVEHKPSLPWKAWYAGPNFRYEKAQKGRYRQFDQVGVEVLGVDEALVDAEVIALAWLFFAALGLRRVTLQLNSLGDAGDRPRYVDALATYLRARESDLSAESRETLAKNPLRVLDSKRDADAPVIEDAPLMVDYLSDASAEHFGAVQAGLRALDVPFTVAPRLVRGLDYYRRTTFEFVAAALDAAQNAVGGGGRYDGLVEAMGGAPTPGIGFALGVDRTLLACDSEGVFAAATDAPEVFVIDTIDGRAAHELTFVLRRAGIAAERAYDGRSMKAQMKAADRAGATLAIIIGSQEQAAGEVTIRSLRTSEQHRVAYRDVVGHVKKLIET